MSDPLVMKVGDTLPSLVVRLTDEDGVAADLTDFVVTFTMVSSTDPYAVKIDAAPTQIALNQADPAWRGIVTYYWQPGDTDTAGEFYGRMVATGSIGTQTYPAEDFIRIVFEPVDVPTALAVTPSAVEVAIGRALTATEVPRVTQLIEQVTALLALWLRRDLTPTTYTAEAHIADEMGRVFLSHGPIRSISEITVDGEAWDLSFYDPNRPLFPPGSTVAVTYSAGDDSVPPAVKGVITEAVARSVLAGPQVSTGAVRGYSVEGTSITYGPVAGENGSVGRVSVADLAGIKRLKRRYAT